MSNRRQDLIGKRYGRGVVTNFIGKDKYNCYVWELVCDCGNTYQTKTGNLNFGHVTSCGCYRNERVIENAKKATAATRMPLGVAAMRSVFKTYRKRALNRGLSFELTLEQFEKYTKMDCIYCGKPPSAFVNGIKKNGGTFTTASIELIRLLVTQ